MEQQIAQPLAQGGGRLMSLDVFRGLTIAGMILVNNPGSWGAMYWPLGHAPWDGWTPTDWIFPFFLFIVGVAMTFSFDKRLARGDSKAGLVAHVFVRAAVLYFLGMILTGFPNFRVITPFILGVVGLQLMLWMPEPEPGAPEPPRGKPYPYMWAGAAIAAVGLVWFVVDFRYFNGPTRRGGFGDLFPLTAEGGSPIRVVGVLQRIALCYVGAALIMVATGVRGRLVAIAVLTIGYWLIMRFVDAPAGYEIGAGAANITVDAPVDAPFRGALNDWIDTTLVGAHLYSHRPDPEGFLSTMTATATVLAGTICGAWIQNKGASRPNKALMMLVVGIVLIVAGEALGLAFPINKKIWSSSYVVSTAGWASALLAACYYAIDVKGWKAWSMPFLVLGMNAILAFFGSGIMARLLGMIRWGEGDGATNLRAWLYGFYTGALGSGKEASLAWALTFVTVWVLLMVPFYRKKIFLKV